MDKVEALCNWLGKEANRSSLVVSNKNVFKHFGKEYVVLSEEEVNQKGKDFLIGLYGSPSKEGNFFIYTV